MHGESVTWSPSPSYVAEANLTAFARRCNIEGEPAETYRRLHEFSIEQPDVFWSELWDFLGPPGERGERVIERREPWYTTKFFPDARLNVATALLEPGADDDVAIISVDEAGATSQLTRAELRSQVRRCATWLADIGVVAGDRVAAYLPNRGEAVVVMLAAAGLGAVFSSVSPDFGVTATLDRFAQIEPAVLFGAAGYVYGGKRVETSERFYEIVDALPSLKAAVMIADDPAQIDPAQPCADRPGAGQGPAVGGTQQVGRSGTARYGWEDVLAAADFDGPFDDFAFDHPWYILYSSGTTGAPKCIVHRTGGVLLTHMKEHRLAVNMSPRDVLAYFTTLGWMMWNWQVSALASGATIVCYDGSPAYPQVDQFLRVAADLGVTILGTSAKYLDSVVVHLDASEGLDTQSTAMGNLRTVKTLCSTGSPLSPETALAVQSVVGPDVLIAPISGGTDLCGCFVGSVPTIPAVAGVMQGAMLGMDMAVFDEEGLPVVGRAGELVCRAPFPSIPIGFWNDPDGSRFFHGYFDRFDGAWYHGDFATETAAGGFIIHGRSDATLNPGGVRIGTAEIYRCAETVPGIIETVAVGQTVGSDTRIVLFVVTAGDVTLDDDLRAEIRKAVRQGASPRHVPAAIYQVSDIPRTRSGKISELAVRAVVDGRNVTNRDALANPECLDQYQAFA